VLFTSVFGPYAQDDEFGSRSINPMELYHNQVTRAQGAFSLRMFHRSWGIMMMQANISAPCAVLDLPTREAFVRELRAHDYDIVGISSIIVNVGKVREMCRLIRDVSPESVIVAGGHVAAIPGIETMIDADHIVRGEGIRWMQEYLDENSEAPIRHPEIVSGMQTRILGVRLPDRKGATAATIIPSVGCPMGCNFCTTSSFFWRKRKIVNFYESGDEIDYAVGHHTDFHQFMLYTPVPGTPLFKEMSEQGRMLDNVDLADIHGQNKFNFQHAVISRDDSKRFRAWAFRRDYEQNGPSLYRMCQTTLQGWRRYKDYPDLRVRERFAREAGKLRTAYNAALWAMEKQFRDVNRSVSEEIRELRREVEREFGTASRVASRLGGPLLLWTSRREERRLAAAHSYEPPTFLERSNWTEAQA